jgi:hypothetical protein
MEGTILHDLSIFCKPLQALSPVPVVSIPIEIHQRAILRRGSMVLLACGLVLANAGDCPLQSCKDIQRGPLHPQFAHCRHQELESALADMTFVIGGGAYKIRGVPYVAQPNSKTCAFAACAMMLQFHGHKAVWPAEWGAYQNFDGFRLTKKKNGIEIHDQFYQLASSNPVVALTSEKSYTATDIQQLLHERGPIVASVDFSQFMMGASGHCITITGASSSKVFYHCPEQGPDQELSFDRILEYCDGFISVCKKYEEPGKVVKF